MCVLRGLSVLPALLLPDYSTTRTLCPKPHSELKKYTNPKLNSKFLRPSLLLQSDYLYEGTRKRRCDELFSELGHNPSSQRRNPSLNLSLNPESH